MAQLDEGEAMSSSGHEELQQWLPELDDDPVGLLELDRPELLELDGGCGGLLELELPELLELDGGCGELLELG